MNIFEFTDHDGDKISIDQNDEFASDGGRFTAAVFNHNTSPVICESVIFGDDAARALIRALREALPPQQVEASPEEWKPKPYKPKRADYIRQAFQLLRDQRMEFCPGDVVQLAYFLSETGS